MSNNQLEKIGIRITEFRNKLALTQAEFGERLGVSLNTQFSYEKGKTPAPADYLCLLIDMGADIQYLMIGEHADIQAYDPLVERRLMGDLMKTALNMLDEELQSVGIDLGTHVRCKFAIAACDDALSEFPDNEKDQLKLIRYGAKMTAKMEKEKTNDNSS